MLSVLDPQKNSGWTDPATAPRVEPFTLPPSTTMMLADVDAGSHTPSMVGKVLQWRKANPDQGLSILFYLSILLASIMSLSGMGVVMYTGYPLLAEICSQCALEQHLDSQSKAGTAMCEAE